MGKTCQTPVFPLKHIGVVRFRPAFFVFLLCFFTFAYFHQGGGWNQNARFAEIRAIVEEGRFTIDNFLVYRGSAENAMAVGADTYSWDVPLHRETIKDGEFTREGTIYRLCWKGPAGTQFLPVNGRALQADNALEVVVGSETCSGDIGYSPTGHFHSNKPPGLSLLATPVYFVAYHLEQKLGFNADSARVLNFNQWLCSVFTVGLASAIGVILVWRMGTRIFPEHPRAALGAALTFGFGTTFFPFGTLLFDHNVTAVLLFGSFAAIRRERLVLGGLCAGLAALCNYLAGLPGAVFGIWALYRSVRAREFGDVGSLSPAQTALRFLAGVVPCFIILLTYNAMAFGTVFALNTSFQNPQFREPGTFLGMFGPPSWFAAQALTVSPWRGLFVLSPVLLLALPPLFRWPRHRRAELRVIVFMMVFFFFVNICFTGFHGGMSAGPRYLIPLLPFLCLGLVPAFARFPRFTTALAAFSIFQQTLLTATDVMNPVGVHDIAWQNTPNEWKEKLYGDSIVWRYAWPLFAQGRADAIIRDEFDEWEKQNFTWTSEQKSRAKSRMDRGIGDTVPLAAMPGPVSVNVVSAFEGGYFQLTVAEADSDMTHSREAHWASFNLGEFFSIGNSLSFAQSRWSLLPLLLLWIYGGKVLWQKGIKTKDSIA
jgi:hypothetical protein